MMFQTLHRRMANGQTLKISCSGCQHTTRWTWSQAFSRLGADATPMEVRTKLRCSLCGAANPAVSI